MTQRMVQMRTGLEGAVTPWMPTWYSGHARLVDGQWIELEDPEEHHIVYRPTLAFDLAGIGDAAEAVAFASRYGLLRTPLGGGELRESFSDWQAVIAEMRWVIELWMLMVRANAEEPAGIDALRRFFDEHLADRYPPLPPGMAVPIGIGRHAISQFTDSWLADGTLGTGPAITTSGTEIPGRIMSWGFRPINLLSAARYQLVAAIVNNQELRHCAFCGRVFPVFDRRQRYHDPNCAQKDRRRRKPQSTEAGGIDAS